MPEERGYDQQTTPRPAAAMPLADARVYGAQVGDALAGAGVALHQDKIRAFQVEKAVTRDREVADWSRRLSEYRTAMEDLAREQRSAAKPGGQGHVEVLQKAQQAARQKLLEGITDPQVQRHATAQLDDFETALRGREGDWQEGQRVAKTVADRQTAVELAANGIRRTGRPEAYAEELKRLHQDNALLAVDPATRDKLDRWGEQVLAVGFIGHLQDTNPRMARAVLDSGEFDHLDPQVLEQLRNGADVEIRRVDAALQHEATMAKSTFTDQLSAAKTDDAAGIDVADRLPALRQFAEASGDASAMAEIDRMAANGAFAKIYSGQGPLQRQQRLAVLEGKEKPSTVEQREIAWLRERRGSLDAQFNADPVQFAIENAPAGGKPPPGDITEPGVIQGRMAWRSAAAQVYGANLPYLSKAEAGQFAARKAEGLGGEDEVLGVLDRWPAGKVRAAVARQIAPEDQVFQHMALLGPNKRRTVRAGANRLAADKGFLTPEKDNIEVAEFFAGIDRQLDQAMRVADPAGTAASKQIARQWLAGVFSASNFAVDDMKDDGLYRLAMAVALGGGKDDRTGKITGGLGNWADSPFVLPGTMTNADFGSAVSADMKRRKTWPVNLDGKPADMLFLSPTLIRPGTYAWYTRDGRPVRDNHGQHFVSQIGSAP